MDSKNLVRFLLVLCFFCLLISPSTVAATAITEPTATKTAEVLSTQPYFNSISNRGIVITVDRYIAVHDLKKQIRIFPSIGHFRVTKRYSSDSNKYEIKGNFETGKSYKLHINKGEVTNARNKKKYLLKELEYSFKAIGIQPKIGFVANRSLLELYSRQIIPLSLKGIENFNVQLTRIPAMFGPAFESLTLFPESEKSRNENTDTIESISTKDKKAIADKMLSDFGVQFDNLKKLDDSRITKQLENFLTPNISKKNQAYLNSGNPDKNNLFSLPLDFRALPEQGGPVLINIHETEKADRQSICHLFQITDLSITYKFSRNELLLWVTSMESGKPCANVSVMLLDHGGKHFFVGYTDRDGIIKIDQQTDYPVITFRDNTPIVSETRLKICNLLIAAVASPIDSSFISLNSNRLYSESARVSAPDMREQLSARGYVFSERGVYRPGETVYWKATVREMTKGTITPPESSKVAVVITNPKGETIYDENHKLSEFGTCSGSLKTKESGPIGLYSLKVYHITETSKSNLKSHKSWDRLMNRSETKIAKTSSVEPSTKSSKRRYLCYTDFQVQHFEPPRHFVSIETTQEKQKVKQIVGRESQQNFLICKIKSQYYAGGILRHAKVQWTAYLTESDSNIKKYPLYQFGSNDKIRELIESGHSVLDKDGGLTIALPVSNSILSGLNSIEISATVLDVDGKPATQVAKFSPEPKYRVGIIKMPSKLAQDSDFPIKAIVTDKNGNMLKKGEIQLEVMRKRWFYNQKRNSEGENFYSWSHGWLRSYRTAQIIKNGVATFDINIADGGDYMLTATFKKDDNIAKAAQAFNIDFSYASFEDFNNKSRTRSENEIHLIPDKDTVASNGRVKIRYSLPRICKYALLTQETDKILSARVIKLDKAHGEFTETITADSFPNTFISFIAPSSRQGFPVYTSRVDSDYPRSYYGYTNIKVQKYIDTLSMEIAPENSEELNAKPGEQQKISFLVKDKDGKPVIAELAVCVVDEAVLSLTGFQTPILNTLADFMSPLSIFTGDLRTSIITQELFKFISSRALTGGGHGSGSIAPDLDVRKDFRPVAYWNPSLITDENGECHAKFELPDSMTSYRIYGVAISKGSAFTSKERQLIVSKEFYIEPGMPRFMTAGDEIDIVVNLSNKSAKSGTATVQIEESVNMAATPIQSQVNIDATSNSISKITLKADNGAGKASLTLKGSFNGLSDIIIRDIPVIPASTIIKRSINSQFSGERKISYDLPEYLAKMSPTQKSGAIKASLHISPSPWIKLAPTLNYLMKYPYGCVEQVSSGILPLIALRSIAKEGKLPSFNIDDIDKFIESGINKLMMMQRTSGGFAYWQSSYEESWWGTQYAVFALTQAKKAGMDIDQQVLDKALRYIKKEISKKHSDKQYLALAMLNLAMNKRLNASDFDLLKKRFSDSDKDTKPLLILAEALIGATEIEELSARISKIKIIKDIEVSDWRYSSIKTNALTLLANLASSGDQNQADDICNQLFESINSQGYWNSTADTGMVLLAIVEYLKKNNVTFSTDIDFKVITSEGSKELNTGKFGTIYEITPEELQNSAGIRIESSGKAFINYCLEYSYPDIMDRPEAVEKGFSIEKKVVNINGTDKIRIGDIVKVSIEFEDKFTEDGKVAVFNYLYLEDPIPAGFVAINPKLKNDSLPDEARNEDEESYCDWSNGAYTFYADHKEIHNDRLVAFKDRVWSDRFRLEYYMRATNAGEFRMKPTLVGLMYNPDYYGMTTSKNVTILPAD